MPRFSIIVGVYNQAETLPGLVESLAKQTFKDFEVHFCDDGSDDGSLEYLNGNQAWGFQSYVHTQEHKGMRLAKNLNRGIAGASGEYCVFVMGDSMLEQDYLEILNEYVQENRIVCGVRIQVSDVGGKMVGVDVDWRLKKNLIPDFPTVLLNSPWACLTGNGLTIPTSALREYGPWNEDIEGYGGEDNEIIARLFYKGFLCWSVPDLRLYHRWHKSTESNYKNASLVQELVKTYGD